MASDLRSLEDACSDLSVLRSSRKLSSWLSQLPSKCADWVLAWWTNLKIMHRKRDFNISWPMQTTMQLSFSRSKALTRRVTCLSLVGRATSKTTMARLWCSARSWRTSTMWTYLRSWGSSATQSSPRSSMSSTSRCTRGLSGSRRRREMSSNSMRSPGSGRPDGLRRAMILLSKKSHVFIGVDIERERRRLLSSSAKIYWRHWMIIRIRGLSRNLWIPRRSRTIIPLSRNPWI